MWCNFNFMDGSNPYITKTYSELFKMFYKYYCVQVGNNSFIIQGLREWNGKKSYKGRKEILREAAIDWQRDFANCNYSWGELAAWQGFFEEYGRKYGLLKEFKENGIC